MGLGAMVLLPLVNVLLREAPGSLSFPNSMEWVKHLTLWVGLFGAFLASLKGQHISIGVCEALLSSQWKARLQMLSRAGATGILICLSVASGIYAVKMIECSGSVGWLPLPIAVAPMALAFAAMAVVTFWRPGEKWGARVFTAGLAFLAGPIMMLIPATDGSITRIVGLVALCSLACFGMPLFAVLGGAAVLLYHLIPEAGSLTWAMDATYQMVSKPLLPSIPLFALAGVVLARGGSPQRLIRLVRAWTDWVPGGAAIGTILACAFFTAITGASGVTILALGALALPVLMAAEHSEEFSLGLLTSSGSVGLLFPPSIPVILCAVSLQVGARQLFLAGILPGLLLLALFGFFSVWNVRQKKTERATFDLGEALTATRVAWGDLLLPVLVLGGIFGGFTSTVEAAALAALWAIILETLIHRKEGLKGGLSGTFIETAALVGALLAIIGLAYGLSSYLGYVMLGEKVTALVTGAIESKLVFLLVLNLLLLVVGAFMDIFSAIVLVVPLLIPLAGHYGISSVHLGILFLANMELGYLTPPVGMNLFLSSLTFDKPLAKVWRASLPFLAIVAGWVLLVTYVPWLSEGLWTLFGGK